jgi:hypothetical protein
MINSNYVTRTFIVSVDRQVIFVTVKSVEEDKGSMRLGWEIQWMRTTFWR